MPLLKHRNQVVLAVLSHSVVVMATLTQLEILSALYNRAGGGAWTDKANWMTGDPCDHPNYVVANVWAGLDCDDGQFTRGIDLSGTNLIGSIPSELGYLTTLEFGLNLAENHLTSSLPSELGLLTALSGSNAAFSVTKNSLAG